MKQANLFEVIFRRKSIRKFDLTPLEDSVLETIIAQIDKLEPMYKDIQVEMKIIPQESIHDIFAIQAPHYIIVSSEKKDGFLTNAGFMLQQMDLFLSSIGVGSCWLGMAKPVKKIGDGSFEFVIALAFGKPAEALHRHDISEFKRKPTESISDCDKDNKIIEAARLAPSATNSQPWYFVVSENNIHVYCVKSNIIKGIIFNRLNRIDMGIAIFHLWIALQHFGKNVTLFHEHAAQASSPKGCYYIASLKNS